LLVDSIRSGVAKTEARLIVDRRWVSLYAWMQQHAYGNKELLHVIFQAVLVVVIVFVMVFVCYLTFCLPMD
jgi:hypothetical protein